MKKLTKEQKTILTTNLEKFNETIIKKTIFVRGSQVLFCTVNEYGTIRQYFVDFELKSCLLQTLSSVCIFEKRIADWFKF